MNNLEQFYTILGWIIFGGMFLFILFSMLGREEETPKKRKEYDDDDFFDQ